MMRSTGRIILGSILALVAVACGDPAGRAETGGATPWPVTEFPPLPDSMQNVPEARIELGHLLFFDPVLSIDKETACATCHSELWGMADGMALAVGHGAGLLAGPGRRGPNTLRRHSPSLFNLAFRESLTWDGRVRTLEEQALIPLFDAREMSADPARVVEDLSSIDEYVERFTDAFPEDPRITIQNLASALAAYQRTFVSDHSAYDAYVQGRVELMTEDEIEGMFRFAEMGCDGCHTPPLFESETFADRNVPGVEGIVDYGREEVTGLPEDRGKFRTVTLRNLWASEPYFHNGSVSSMKAAAVHELEQGDIPFTDEDVRLITVFLNKSLRDIRNLAIRPAKVPSGLEMPIDPPGSR
jgi:cytochrome c peroxidase